MSCLEYCQKQLQLHLPPSPPPLSSQVRLTATGDTAGITTFTVPLTGMRTINMNLFAGHNHENGPRYNVTAGSTTATSCPPGFMFDINSSACTPAEWRQTISTSTNTAAPSTWLQSGTVELQMEYPHPTNMEYTFISQNYQDSGYEEFGTRNNRWKTVQHGLEQHLVAVKFYPDDPDKLRDKCCYRLPYDMFTWKQNTTFTNRGLEEYHQLDINHHECNTKPTIKMRGAGWGTDLDFCEIHSKEAYEWHKAVMDNEINYDDLLWTIQKENPEVYDIRQAKFDLEKQAREHVRHMRLLEADAKADKLLQKWLSPDEYSGLKEKGFMEYQSKKHSDTVYIIRKDYSRKIIKKVNGIETEELCVMPVTPLCNDDNLLSKIMLLKTDEDQFLKTANHFPLFSHYEVRQTSNNGPQDPQVVLVDRNQ